MYCNYCGCLLHEGEQFCPGCGMPGNAGPRASKPVAPPAPMYVAAGQPSGKATASLICGIFFFLLPAAICAIILGHIAHSEIKRSAGRLIGSGRATAGLVLGYMGIAFIPLILIIAAIAIPNLLRARTAANEASAIGSIRTITNAQSAFRSGYPDVGYACELSQLGGNNANANSAAAGLIDDRLATGTKSGYRFQLTDCAASSDGGAHDSYKVFAEPIEHNVTGKRSFCSDQNGVIKALESGGDLQSCEQHGVALEWNK